jgi:hypothetical protein
MADKPTFIGSYRNQITQLIPNFATRPRIIWSPGSNGSRLHAITLATNEDADTDIQFYLGEKLTAQADMGTGSFVDNGGSADEITRTSGSFITDGWRVGNRLVVQGATTVANDVEVIITGVTATTLTLSTGGGDVDTAEDLPTGAGLYRVTKLGYQDLPLGSGEPSVDPVNVLNAAEWPFLDESPDRYLTIGPDTYLLAATVNTLDTGEVVDINCFGGDY